MKSSTEADEVSTEQLFSELASYLVEAEEILLPSLEAKVRDIREVCKNAYGVLTGLEHRVIFQKRKK